MVDLSRNWKAQKALVKIEGIVNSAPPVSQSVSQYLKEIHHTNEWQDE
jgi:hypothetical protein